MTDSWNDERSAQYSSAVQRAQTEQSQQQQQQQQRQQNRRHPNRKSVIEIINNLGREDDVDIHPALERRIRDFRFAQRKRRERYGSERPWGILGLYDHLASIRCDLEWAEDAAWRRQHDQPYLSWADFEQARAKGHNRPFFTYFILFFCTIMLVVSIGMNGWAVEPMSINPTIGPSGKTLLNLGAKETNLIVNGGEWFRLFSPMVLHAGIIHYFLNMLALWFVGSAIEQSHGFVSTAIAFIIAGVGGNVLSAIFLPQYISVGASGGIFGFIGMCISDIVVNWNILFLKEPDGDEKGSRFRHYMILAWLVFDIFINCLVGLTPLVDNFTHLGGLIYGFLCGLSTIERIEIGFFGVNAASWEKIRSNLVKFGGLIISVLLIMITTVILVESDGATSPCHACRYVSCIPFPPLKENKWWYCDDCGSVAADANKVNEQAEFFDSLDLTCPDGQIERISIAAEMITDQEVIRRKLPAYCRNFCESVYHRSG